MTTLAVADPREIALPSGSGPQRIKLLPLGEIRMRDGRGPFILADREHAEAVIAATRAHLGKTDLMLDYDHQALHAPRPGVGGTARAAGWIDPASLAATDEGIFGDVSWTQAAATQLAAREYRYLSPTFLVDPITRRVRQLSNAALVNMPAIDMPAIAAAFDTINSDPAGDAADASLQLVNQRIAASMQPVTQPVLEALRVSFDARFKAGLSKAKPVGNDIVTRVPSGTRINTYGFLGDLPQFREWIGEKRRKTLEEKAYQLVNRNFEVTLGIHKHKIADDNIGMYPAIFEDWGSEAAYWSDRLIFEALSLGHTKAIYDNQNFFDASHPSYRDDGNAWSNIDTTGGGQPWYLLDLSRAVKPLIFQEREKPHFWMVTDPQDSKVADTGEFGCYGEARGACGYALPFLAYRSTAVLNTASFTAARSAMRSWTDDVGDPRGIKPTHIVVGVSNFEQARSLFARPNLAGGESNLLDKAVIVIEADRLP